MVDIVNNQYADSQPQGELFGIGAKSLNAAVCASITLEAAAATINDNSYADAESVYYKSGNGTLLFDVSVHDFYNRRQQWAFGTTNATARKWPALWVGPPAGSDAPGRVVYVG